VHSQGSRDAYFTEWKCLSKIYQGDEDSWSFTIYNEECSVDIWGRAWFFFKFYENGRLILDEYQDGGTWQCNKGKSVTRSYSFSAKAGPRVCDFKIELYWDHEGTPYLQDTVSFTVTIVRVYIDAWSPSSCTALLGMTTPSTLSISLKNGGNDYMYDVKISVVDSAGLQVSPQSQDLVSIVAGGSKSTSFSVTAPATLTPGTYTVKFQVAYDDFRGISHTETRSAQVLVRKSNTKITLSLESESVSVGSSITMKATLKDEMGNSICDAVVDFYIYKENTWEIIDSVDTDSEGVASTIYTPTVSGSFQIKAVYKGSNIYLESESITASLDVFEAHDIARTLNLPISTYTLLMILAVIAVICATAVIVVRKRK